MGRFVKGEVVVIPFPFSKSDPSRRRPALVLASLPENILILCMITSRFTRDSDTIVLRDQDFIRGSLNPKNVRTLSQDSHIRPNRLMTVEEAMVVRSAGQISNALTKQVIQKVIQIIRQS